MEKKKQKIYVVVWCTSHVDEGENEPIVDNGAILCHTKKEAINTLEELRQNSYDQVMKPHAYKYADENSYYVESEDKKHWERAQILVSNF